MAALDFPASPTDGQVYTANGVTYVWSAADTAWKGQGSQVPLSNKMRVIAYPLAGTFAYVKPANLKALQVELASGGGGSGGAAVTAATTTSAGGGGGGGGYTRKLYQADELAASEPLVIGAGGSAGDGASVIGTAGGTSTFKGLSVTGGGFGANGGAGTTYTATSRGTAGSGNGGDFNGQGNSGFYGLRNCFNVAGSAQPGYGGAAYGKGQYYYNASLVTTSVPADVSGSMNNSGANGAANGFSQTVTPGAKGGDGYAIFTEYYAENDTTSGGGGGDYLPLSGGTLTGALTGTSINHAQQAAGQTLWNAWINDLGYNEYAWRFNGTDPKTMVLRRYDGLVSSAYRNLITITPTSGQDADISLNNLTMQRGIIFPASQVVSADPNALDDSERGSFTPAVEGTTAAGSGTYTFRSGRYTKIGNKVFFELMASWTAHTGTGNIKISGLPFASIVGSWGPVVSIHADSLTFSGQLSATIPNGQVYVSLATITTNAASGAVAMDTSATLNIAGHYTAA